MIGLLNVTKNLGGAMRLKKKRIRRSDKKIMTKEARILKFLRESRNLSMRKVAPMMNISEATVNHCENGRRDLDKKMLLKFLNIYGYSWEQFQMFLDGNYEVPEHLRSECIDIINRLDVSKLKTIKSILETF